MTYCPLTMTRLNDEDKEELKGKKKRSNIQKFKSCDLVLMLDLLSTIDRSF